MHYDLLAIDVGITPDLDDIPGAREHAIAVKPISEFMPKWMRLLDRALTPAGPRRFAAIGGGAAGVELILAARHRLLTEAPAHGLDPSQFTFTLFAGTAVLSSHNSRAQRLAAAALAIADVTVIENDLVAAVTGSVVHLASSRKVPVDATLISTKAKAPPWFAATDLPLDRGFLALRPTLQLLDDDTIFASGDCVNVLAHPRDKAGVFAVRQGPIVAANLRRSATGGTAMPLTPQKQFLSLVSLGEKSAIASRGPFAAGRWAWRLNDTIDRALMNRRG